MPNLNDGAKGSAVMAAGPLPSGAQSGNGGKRSASRQGNRRIVITQK